MDGRNDNIGGYGDLKANDFKKGQRYRYKKMDLPIKILSRCDGVAYCETTDANDVTYRFYAKYEDLNVLPT